MADPDSPQSPAPAQTKLSLRRDVTVWGSYMWGYADVGADIYTALGLVIASAQGAANLAFALAGMVYIMIGLCYTELAAAYPVAGGGHYFTLRGLGDLAGFIAGTALLLDYTIDIALFAVASAGYLNFFLPYFFGVQAHTVVLRMGPLRLQWLWLLEASALIALLVWLNIRGIRESSLLNEVLGLIDICTESAIIILGFLFAFRPELLVHQWRHDFPTLHHFMYGSSLAIISFVGLESISQAAQETRRPATIIPRTSLTLIFTVFIFALAFSTLTLGVLPWRSVPIDDPVAHLAHRIPYAGLVAGPFAAILGASILLISANSGVMSVSRLTFSMSQLRLVTKWLDAVHPKYRTPYRAILLFSFIGWFETFLSFLTPSAMDTLGNLYAFGATLGYLLVFVSLIVLRVTDPYTPRPYRMPLNLPLRVRGRRIQFPLLGVLGMLGVGLILFEVILTHKIGRIAGPAWVAASFLYYLWYRRRQKLPVLGSIARDWEGEQRRVLEEAEEFELLEEYNIALAQRDRERGIRTVSGQGSPPPSYSAQAPKPGANS
jgi:basic amino acid/polyamine antiporter, APA family